MAKLSKMHKRVIDATRSTAAPALRTAQSVTDKLMAADDLTAALDSIDGLVLPENSHWDEAESFYVNTVAGILSANEQTASHLAALLAEPSTREKYLNDQRLALLVNALNTDIQSTLGRLNAVHAQHEGKVGGSKTTEEIAQAIGLFGQYSDILEIYNTLIMPTVSEILSHTGGIEEIQSAAREEVIQKSLEAQMSRIKEAQDPNVITDVVFEESTNNG